MSGLRRGRASSASAIGWRTSRGGRRARGCCSPLVVGLLVAVAVRPLGDGLIALARQVPGLRKAAPKLAEFYDATREVLAPAPLLVATLLSVAAWFAECAAFYLIVGGFAGAD